MTITMNIITTFLSFILFVNFTLFYMDDFKLSENKYIRLFQILTPVWLLLFVYTLFYLDILSYNHGALPLDGNKNTNNTVNIGGSIEMDRDAAEVIGRNIGIAGTVAGVSGAVGKAIAKSSMPPLQKAGIIVGAGIAGGAIHVGTSVVNRVVNTPDYTKTSHATTNFSGGINKLMPDSGDSGYTDLMLLILSIDTLTSVCLGLIIILFIMILFKFFFNEEKIQLNLSN